MNKYKIHILASILGLLFMSCQNQTNKLTWDIEGPYFEEEILNIFELDSIDFSFNPKNHFVVSIKNNNDEAFKLRSTSQNQIFPDSSRFRTYSPYMAKNKSWVRNVDGKPNEIENEVLILPGSEHKFWFISSFDNFIDSLAFFFNIESNISLENHTEFLKKIYQPTLKQNLNFSLIEDEDSYIVDSTSTIITNYKGPIYYRKAKMEYGFDLKSNNDVKEVFIVSIENLDKEDLLVIARNETEIICDSIYHYSTFSQTSKEKIWIKSTKKIPAVEMDTVIVRPNQVKKFWTYFEMITPQTDSIAFYKKLESETNYYYTSKLYELKKRDLIE